MSHHIRKIKAENVGKHHNQKSTYSVKNKQLYVNGQQVVKQVHTPSVNNLFVNATEQDKTDKVKLVFSEPHEEKGSIFTVVAAKVSSLCETRHAYRKVKQLYPSTMHISMAYSCQRIGNDNQDDYEYGCGLSLQKTLEDMGAVNKAVFLVRSYGSCKLGAVRHVIEQQLVKEVLVKMQK